MPLTADQQVVDGSRRTWTAPVIGLAIVLLAAGAAWLAASRTRLRSMPAVSLQLVDGAPAGAGWQVGYRVLDPATLLPGPYVELGPLPVERTRFEPAYVRFVVLGPKGELLEFARALRWCDAPRSIHVDPKAWTRRPKDESGDDGGHESHPLDGRAREWTPTAAQRSDAFELDGRAVSVREYRDFLVATGVRPPARWEEIGRSRFDERPVLGVTFDDATRYSEWVGRRLPTESELAASALGIDVWSFPYAVPIDKVEYVERDPARGILCARSKGP